MHTELTGVTNRHPAPAARQARRRAGWARLPLSRAAAVAVPVAVALMTSVLAPPGVASAQQNTDGLGGQVYSTGDPIIVTVLNASAGITSSLHLLEPGPERYIATNREVGREITLPAVPAGAELVFGIRANGNEFRIGPATRNPDGQVHARVTTEPGRVIVGFEDLFGGGDRDYDDNLFAFRGGISDKPVVEEVKDGHEPINIVHVGDSYSAGNGARTTGGDRSYYGSAGCYRSRDSWGNKFKDYLTGRGYAVNYTKVACSGGVLDDYTVPRTMESDRFAVLINGEYTPQRKAEVEAKVNETVEVCTPREFEYNTITVEYAIDHPHGSVVHGTCQRYQPPQFEEVNEGTDLIVMTGGGNDLKFSKLVQNCLVLMSPSACRGQVSEARDMLDPTKKGNINDELVATLRDLSTRVHSRTRVAYIGYPLLEQDEDFTIKNVYRPLGFGPGITLDSYRAGEQIRQLGRDGAAAQARAIATVNAEVRNKFGGDFVTYAPVESGPESFEGKEPRASGTNPQRHVFEAFETRIKIEWYHPNPDGHMTYAGQVQRTSGRTALFGAKPAGGMVDVLLAVDNTASMAGAVASLARRWPQVADEIEADAGSVRFALTTFRDSPAAAGASPGDYVSRREVAFTSDTGKIGTALGALSPSGGGDRPDAALSGMHDGMTGNRWRTGAKKVVMLLTDAPAHDPEGFGARLTREDVARTAFRLDPAEVFVVDTSAAGDATGPGTQLRALAEQTRGAVRTSAPDDAGQAVSTALTEAIAKPFPLVSTVGQSLTGRPVTFSAAGTFHPDGAIASYDWDFDGDGTNDARSTSGQVTHTYSTDYDGLVALTVTDARGASSVATTPVLVTRDGDGTGQGDVCPDAYDPEQEDTDGDGLGDACETDAPVRPDPETYGSARPAVDPDGDSSLESVTAFVTPNANVAGRTAGLGDLDWTGITATEGTLQVALVGASSDLDLFLTDEFGAVLASSFETGARSETVRVTVPAGRYFSVVVPRSSSDGPAKYRLEITSLGR